MILPPKANLQLQAFFITVLLFLLFAGTTRVNKSFSDALAFGSFWGGLYFPLTSDLFISLDYVE